jgi:hypothetical protein
VNRARQHAFPVLLALGVERPRGGLVAGRRRRMTRRMTAELLAAAFARLRRVRGAGEVQDRAERHRAVAPRKDEASGPPRIAGAVLEDIAPWRLGDERHARRHPGAPELARGTACIVGARRQLASSRRVVMRPVGGEGSGGWARIVHQTAPRLNRVVPCVPSRAGAALRRARHRYRRRGARASQHVKSVPALWDSPSRTPDSDLCSVGIHHTLRPRAGPRGIRATQFTAASHRLSVTLRR